MFADVALWRASQFTARATDEAVRVQRRIRRLALSARRSAFSRFSAARSPRAEDRDFGGARVVVVSYELWQQMFNAESTALGRTLDVDGVPYTVDRRCAAGVSRPLGRIDVLDADRLDARRVGTCRIPWSHNLFRGGATGARRVRRARDRWSCAHLGSGSTRRILTSGGLSPLGRNDAPARRRARRRTCATNAVHSVRRRRSRAADRVRERREPVSRARLGAPSRDRRSTGDRRWTLAARASAARRERAALADRRRGESRRRVGRHEGALDAAAGERAPIAKRVGARRRQLCGDSAECHGVRRSRRLSRSRRESCSASCRRCRRRVRRFPTRSRTTARLQVGCAVAD